jgi:threonylcarbamoyladenosine tRNA methylthiotransferase MtaB
MRGKTFRIITLGCKVNQYESAYLNAALSEAGMVPAGPGEPCDVALIHTCIVTRRAAHQSRQQIRKAIRENPDGVIGAVGCYPQVFPEEITGIQGITLMAGNRAKSKLPDTIRACLETREKASVVEPFSGETPFEPMPLESFPGRTRAYLKIQDGCESYCSYCIVPYARGPCRSLAPDRVLAGLGALSESGYLEVVLTGIHLGKYGEDLSPKWDLVRLLRAIGKAGFPGRIRLSSLEPQEIHDALIELMAGEDWLCRHVHIPLQSGDDGVLKRMNRQYRAGSFARLVERIYSMDPVTAIGVDVMAGFPGEGPEAHGNSLSLVRDLPVSYLHVFPYSPRPGTPAAGYRPQLQPELIKKRAGELRTLGRKKRAAFYASCVGRTFQVLCQGWESVKEQRVRSVSDNYLPVFFRSEERLENVLVPVRIEGASQGEVFGRKAPF